MPEQEQPEAEAVTRLRAGLAQLTEDLPNLLKYPSHLDQAESAIYGAALTLLVESSAPELAQLVRTFLASFHAQIDQRRRSIAWEYNGQWFAGPAKVGSDGHPTDDVDPNAPRFGPFALESYALEALYAAFPDLR